MVVIKANFFANSDSVLSSVHVVYEQKSKMNSTSINKKESRLVLLFRRQTINIIHYEPVLQYKLEIGQQIVTKYNNENRVSELPISPNGQVSLQRSPHCPIFIEQILVLSSQGLYMCTLTKKNKKTGDKRQVLNKTRISVYKI